MFTVPTITLDSNRFFKSHNQVACAVIFCLFSFVYLFFYQADVLAAAQHVLSEGKTHYGRTVGAVLITLTLFLLQRVVYEITKLEKRAHALTYFPSLLVLTIITDVSSNIDQGFSFGWWYLAFPLLLILFYGLALGLKQVEPFEPESASMGYMSRTTWVNVLTLVAMFIGVGLFSNADETFHYRMRMERLVAEGKYTKALKVGKASGATDHYLTSLRAFILSRKGLIGEHFFEFPVARKGDTVAPDSADLRNILLPDSVMIDYSKTARAKLDYKLIDLLIDKNLEGFGKLVAKAYPDSIFPKHYAEALILNQWKKGKLADDDDSELANSLRDFLKPNGKRKVVNTKMYAWKHYRHTYWYYYIYGGNKEDS